MALLLHQMRWTKNRKTCEKLCRKWVNSRRQPTHNQIQNQRDKWTLSFRIFLRVWTLSPLANRFGNVVVIVSIVVFLILLLYLRLNLYRVDLFALRVCNLNILPVYVIFALALSCDKSKIRRRKQIRHRAEAHETKNHWRCDKKERRKRFTRLNKRTNKQINTSTITANWTHSTDDTRRWKKAPTTVERKKNWRARDANTETARRSKWFSCVKNENERETKHRKEPRTGEQCACHYTRIYCRGSN